MPSLFPSVPGVGDTGPSLSDRAIRDLLAQVQSMAMDARIAEARKRWDIWREDFREHIDHRIQQTHHDPDTIGRICRFSSMSLNLAKDVTRRVAVTHKTPIRRELKGAADTEAQAFRVAYEEALVDARFQEFAQHAFLLGPIIVVPYVGADGRLGFDELRPDQYMVELDADRRTVARITYRTGTGENLPTSQVTTTILDAEAWTTFDWDGRMVDRLEHHMGEFPGVVWRLDTPTDPDWYSASTNQRLIDATIEVAYIYALMNFVRKSQSKKLGSLSGPLEGLSPGQKIDAEKFLALDGDAGDLLQVQVHDFDTDPVNFIRHMEFVANKVVESGFGIPASAFNFDFGEEGNETMSLSIAHDALSDIRNSQIPYMRGAERETAWKATRMMRRNGHHLRLDLPDDAMVREGFRTEWPELNRVDDPLRLAKLVEFEKAHGLISDIDVIQRRHPTMSRAEARAYLMARLREQAKINDFVAERQMRRRPPEAGSGIDGTAAAQGRQGPPVRDAKKTPEGDDE